MRKRLVPATTSMSLRARTSPSWCASTVRTSTSCAARRTTCKISWAGSTASSTRVSSAYPRSRSWRSRLISPERNLMESSRATATLLQGITVGNIFGEQKVFEVVVKGTPKVRESVESVRNMLIDTPGGGHVRLEQVADVRTQLSPAVIKRDAAERYIDVEANVSGRSLGAVATDVEDRLADADFPLEYHAEVL